MKGSCGGGADGRAAADGAAGRGPDGAYLFAEFSSCIFKQPNKQAVSNDENGSICPIVGTLMCDRCRDRGCLGPSSFCILPKNCGIWEETNKNELIGKFCAQ